MVVGGEPADDPDGDGRVEGVGDPPQLVAAGLSYLFEGRGLFGGFGGEVRECLQQRDRDSEEPASLFLAWVSQRSNSSIQSTITSRV